MVGDPEILQPQVVRGRGHLLKRVWPSLAVVWL